VALVREFNGLYLVSRNQGVSQHEARKSACYLCPLAGRDPHPWIIHHLEASAFFYDTTTYYFPLATIEMDSSSSNFITESYHQFIRTLYRVLIEVIINSHCICCLLRSHIPSIIIKLWAGGVSIQTGVMMPRPRQPRPGLGSILLKSIHQKEIVRRCLCLSLRSLIQYALKY
jgi:hypothetical protein